MCVLLRDAERGMCVLGRTLDWWSVEQSGLDRAKERKAAGVSECSSPVTQGRSLREGQGRIQMGGFSDPGLSMWLLVGVTSR